MNRPLNSKGEIQNFDKLVSAKGQSIINQVPNIVLLYSMIHFHKLAQVTITNYSDVSSSFGF